VVAVHEIDSPGPGLDGRTREYPMLPVPGQAARFSISVADFSISSSVMRG
jgi:hypothetical protein